MKRLHTDNGLELCYDEFKFFAKLKALFGITLFVILCYVDEHNHVGEGEMYVI